MNVLFLIASFVSCNVLYGTVYTLDYLCLSSKTVLNGSYIETEKRCQMKIKTDEKRQHIIETAYRLFRINGFDKTSMSEITAQAGGSKATLYNYFPSKEELFVECMFDIVENYLEGIFSSLQDPTTNLRASLQSFGENALRIRYSSEMVANQRLMIAEAGRGGIGKMFHEKINSLQEQTAEFIDKAMNIGKLRRGDQHLAAAQFKALMEAEIHESYLLCVRTTPPGETEIAAKAEVAADAFLRIYAPDAG
jgi:AcrR family transcriptional regulator